MARFENFTYHNDVAYLKKNAGNEYFHQVLTFLQNSVVSFALAISPTMSTSLVEQFWTTAKFKTLNNKGYIEARVSKQKVIITEASIIRDLLFNNANGVTLLSNIEI